MCMLYIQEKTASEFYCEDCVEQEVAPFYLDPDEEYDNYKEELSL